MKTEGEMTPEILETYFVSGVLKNEAFWSASKLSIYREVEAVSASAAANSFEECNWLWVEPPTVWLITEAEKMKKAGQPTLFPLALLETS